MLANLIRRYSVKPENIWDCDEKGITLRWNQIRARAIERQGTKHATTITKGSREYCSILDIVNTAGQVIPPFIVWQVKTTAHYTAILMLEVTEIHHLQSPRVAIWVMN